MSEPRRLVSGGSPRQAMAARFFAPLAAILALAFVLRLGAVLWLADTVPHSDAAYYHLAAQKMAADWRFPFDRAQVEYYGRLGWWPPLYPAFLSCVYRLFGVSSRTAAGVQVLLGTLVVGIVHRLGRRAGGPAVANVAALAVAVNPTYVFLTNILASENLYVGWLALGLWIAGQPWPNAARSAGVRSFWHDFRAPVLAGLAFGFGALTRAIGVLVPVVVALASYGRVTSRRVWLTSACCMVGMAALVIAPWTVRNAVVAGSPALVCFGGGLNFYFGHNEQSVGYRDLSQTPMALLTTQVQVDRMGYRLGFASLARQPLGFVTRGVRKVGALFGPPGYAPHENSAILLPDGWQTDPEKGRQAAELRARQRGKNVYLDGLFTRLGTLHSWLLLIGTLAACLGWRRLPAELRTWAWLCLYWVLAHVVFWAQPRFRYPMEIPMALLMAYAIVGLASRLRRHPLRARAAALLLVAPLAAATLAGSGCAPPPPMPAVESWGDPARPFDDPIEVAAASALGPRPSEFLFDAFDPVRLADFLLLDATTREGRESAARGLVEQAITLRQVAGIDSLPRYLEALRIDPTCGPAYEEATRVLLERGQTERGRALALQGIRLDPRGPKLWGMLGEVYLRNGDDARARQALEHALALGPAAVPDAWQALAVLYLRSGQTARADSLIQRAPPHVGASMRSYVAGMHARETGDLETARREFAAAASDSNAAPAVLVEWGNAEFAAGHLDVATHAYQRALRDQPDARAALNGLGIVQRAHGDPEGAARTFGRIVARQPQDAAAQFNLAGASLEAAQRRRNGAHADSLYATSEAAFSRCVDLGFRASEARLRRAEIHLSRGQPAAAYQEAYALLGDRTQASAARLIAGRAALALHRPQDVVAVLAPPFQADSLGVDGICMLGTAYLQLEMPAYAARALRRAHERRPEDWKTAMNLGVALSESGDLAAAESLLRPLAAAHPDDPDVLQNLAAVLQRRGKRQEADRLLHQADALRERPPVR